VVSETWTLTELVDQVEARLAQLPTPKNGQVRAVPDDRTIRYYGTIGLLDRPALRGRTALYNVRHLAQIVAIKRLQATGRSLAEIAAMWAQLTDESLMSLSGVALPAKGRAPARKEFWKREARPQSESGELLAPAPGPTQPSQPNPEPAPPRAQPASRVSSARMQPEPAVFAPSELRVQLAPNVFISIAMPADGGALALSHADVRAIRAAAAPLVAELARRQLTPQSGEEEP